MYGNLGRIGVITLATDTSVHPEIQRLMPKGVHTYPRQFCYLAVK